MSVKKINFCLPWPLIGETQQAVYRKCCHVTQLQRGCLLQAGAPCLSLCTVGLHNIFWTAVAKPCTLTTEQQQTATFVKHVITVFS